MSLTRSRSKSYILADLTGGSDSALEVYAVRSTGHILYAVPREHVNAFLEGDFITNTSRGVYILANRDGSKKAYIGQSSKGSRGIPSRIKSHVRDKDFWDIVYVFKIESATDNGLQQLCTDLEALAIETAIETNRYALTNKDVGTSDIVNRSDAEHVLESLSDLLRRVNMPIFEMGGKSMPVTYQVTSSNGSNAAPASAGDMINIYATRGGDVIAKAVYNKNDSRVTIFKGTKITFTKRGRASSSQSKLIGNGTLVEVNGDYVFTDDYVGTVSGTATILLGRATNGWVTWKIDSSGEVIDTLRAKTAP